MKRLVLAMMIILTGLALSSCYRLHRIEGNGHVVISERITGVFTGIDVKGEFDVRYIKDTACFAEIEAEENLIPYINTDVSGSVMDIDVQGHRNLRPNHPMIVYVHAPSIDMVRLSGSGTVSGDTLTGPLTTLDLSGSGDISFPLLSNKVIAEISGSGSMHLSGEADRAELRVSGSGNIHAYNLWINECMARISGSGDMYLQVSQLLDVVISGSGNVYYYGNPSVSVSVTGSGQLIHQ